MNPLSVISSILSTVAPVLSSVLGSNTNPTWVTTALNLLARVLNTNATPSEIEAKLKEIDANKMIQLKQLDVSLQLQLSQQQYDLAKQEILADSQIAHDQAEIVKIDAGSGSKYQSWYRPTMAWVSVAAMGYTLLIVPILASFGLSVYSPEPSLLTLAVVNILGIGSMRTWEKYKGLTK